MLSAVNVIMYRKVPATCSGQNSIKFLMPVLISECRFKVREPQNLREKANNFKTLMYSFLIT